MANRLYSIFISSIIMFVSCASGIAQTSDVNAPQMAQTMNSQIPDFNYTVTVPAGWTIRDTTMPDGMKIKFLLPPPALREDYPAGNVLIAGMEGRNIDDFTTRNMNYLKLNMPGIAILERGSIDSTAYSGQWFTYTKEQNGVVRDMINYIIPLNGFAYMITCGSNKGSFYKYRNTFDNIARSFKG